MKSPFTLQKGAVVRINTFSFVPYLLLDSNHQIFWPATEYIRYVGERGIDQKSIYNDATRLRKFLTWVYENSLSFNDVTDETLLAYKQYLSDYENTTLTAYFKSIIQCYAVSQELGYIKNHIGQSSFDKKSFFKIHISYNKKDQRSYNTVSWIYTPRVIHNAPNVPTTKEIEDLIEHIIETETGHSLSIEMRQRDYLLVCWMRDAFLREAEVVGLTLDNLPKRSKLLAINHKTGILLGHDKDDSLNDLRTPITLINGVKYKKQRTVHVPTALILETLDFVNNDRVEILNAANNRKSKALFPNIDTGMHLTPNYIPHLFQGYCNKLKFHINPHKLRKYGITKLLYLLILDKESKNKGTHSRESIIFEVSQMAGHSSIQTTEKYYVDLKKMGGFYDRSKLTAELESVDLLRNNQLLTEQIALLKRERMILKKRLSRMSNNN